MHGAGGDAEVSRVVSGGAADAAEKRLVVLHERLLRVVRRARVADVRRARQLLLAETGLKSHSILLRVPLLSFDMNLSIFKRENRLSRQARQQETRNLLCTKLLATYSIRNFSLSHKYHP